MRNLSVLIVVALAAIQLCHAVPVEGDPTEPVFEEAPGSGTDSASVATDAVTDSAATDGVDIDDGSTENDFITDSAATDSTNINEGTSGSDYTTVEEVKESKFNRTISTGQFPWEKSGYFEGDIIVSKTRNGMTDTNLRWPGRTMPYYIDPSFNSKERETILSAITEIQNLGCVNIRQYRRGDVDFVWIKNDKKGCTSDIGRMKGQQDLNLERNTGPTQTGCVYKGVAMHELLHALGFAHQQSAAERDDFVTVLWRNIESGKEHNFRKLEPSESTNFGVKYDLLSIMHYSGFAFGKDGKRTMQAKDPNAEMGQIEIMRNSDILKLKRMYGCS